MQKSAKCWSHHVTCIFTPIPSTASNESNIHFITRTFRLNLFNRKAVKWVQFIYTENSFDCENICNFWFNATRKNSALKNAHLKKYIQRMNHTVVQYIGKLSIKPMEKCILEVKTKHFFLLQISSDAFRIDTCYRKTVFVPFVCARNERIQYFLFFQR